MNYSAITPKRKVEIATSVLLLKNYGFTLDEIKGIDLNSSSDNEICDYLKDSFEMDIECYEVQEGL